MAKKVIRNDEGKVVPEHCSCGGKIGVFIEGEPIYKCTACGKYYGTMPFSKKSLNESLNRENKNMKKKTITLNESQLRNIVKESVTNILKEGFFNKIFSKNREASNGKQDWAPFNVVRKTLLTAAENTIKAIIHDRLKGRGQPISINRIEVAHMMLSDFVKDEDYYKKYVPLSCVCKLNWYLTTGNEPDVLNAIKQAYDNIRKKMMAGQAL